MNYYAAGTSGAKASTIYPCGHMAYYDSGSPQPTICPICGARHQNADMAASAGYARVANVSDTANLNVINSTSANPNVTFAQMTSQMIGSGVQIADAGLAEELKYPDLAWLDREISRYTKP